MAYPQRPEDVRSSLRTVDVETGEIGTVYEKDFHFEAPNWSPDGTFFVVNSGGKLYRLPTSGEGELVEIPTGFATRLNNDHGISPDGELLVVSHHAEEHVVDPDQEWLASSLYILPVDGGEEPRKVTRRAPSFWHGWSPDGERLAYTALRDGAWDVYTIAVEGGEELRLTSCEGLDDGPDYSADGELIYYNSYCSGSMEIWRMRTDGTEAEQLTRDEHSNWFPHPSPDGRWVVFLTYIEDQGESHPFGRQVKLRLLDLRDDSVRDLTEPFFGGQGTLNVPSWAPDGRKLAYVAYSAGVSPASADGDSSPRAFFESLSALCGSTFEGTMSFPPGPEHDFAGKLLVAQVATCSENEIRVPFAVGENRSRTRPKERHPEVVHEATGSEQNRAFAMFANGAEARFGSPTKAVVTMRRESLPTPLHLGIATWRFPDLPDTRAGSVTMITGWRPEAGSPGPEQEFLWVSARTGQE